MKQEDNHSNVLNDETFTYDVNNNRIGVSLNGAQQLYTVYDGANPYMDFNGSGSLTERYLANPKALSQFYGEVNASGTAQWFLTDNINSIRQVVSTTGSVLDAITYDPYGNIVSQTNSANAPSIMYAGGAYDSITGNVQFDARPYSPGDGRFDTQDPLSFKAGDSDLYRYVFNSPISATDPSGLQKKKVKLHVPYYISPIGTVEVEYDLHTFHILDTEVNLGLSLEQNVFGRPEPSINLKVPFHIQKASFEFIIGWKPIGIIEDPHMPLNWLPHIGVTWGGK